MIYTDKKMDKIIRSIDNHYAEIKVVKGTIVDVNDLDLRLISSIRLQITEEEFDYYFGDIA